MLDNGAQTKSTLNMGTIPLCSSQRGPCACAFLGSHPYNHPIPIIIPIIIPSPSSSYRIPSHPYPHPIPPTALSPKEQHTQLRPRCKKLHIRESQQRLNPKLSD